MNVWRGMPLCEERVANRDRGAVDNVAHRASRNDDRDGIGAGPRVNADAVWFPDAVGDLENVGEHGLVQAGLVVNPDVNDSRTRSIGALGAWLTRNRCLA